MAKFKVVGISFDHMHMGDLLRLVHENPDADLAGIFDPNPAKMAGAIANFGIPADRVFTDFDACMKATKPDLAILCAATADHATYTERLAKYGVHVFVEKPFAASVADARRMIAAMKPTGKIMAINWPLVWVQSHVTAKRLIEEGTIGDLIEVHFQDGNRGPLYHLADKVEVSREEVERLKPDSWWYKRASGGGSLLDYLGYGSTLGTWYLNGEAPLEITCTVDQRPGIEVDQHSITVCRYARGLSRMETRWGTLTDPWTIQPQPTCGFVFVGTDGSISSPDYATHVSVQTRAHPQATLVPVDALPMGKRNAIEYVLNCIKTGEPLSGPLDPEVSLMGQRIVDTAAQSAKEKRHLGFAAMTDEIPSTDTYALKAAAVSEIAAPELDYRPPNPKGVHACIGLIGAGGIAASHLDAYRTAGWDVAAICSRTIAKAQSRAAEFAPNARVTDRYEDVLADPDINIVDITPHPAERLPIIEAALKAGKHVLSQKPFVLDLKDGERLVKLARDHGVKLAVNQNGRWAPHLSWMREAVRAGLIGEVTSVHTAVHWNHGWIAGTPFEKIEDVILYDFSIHWFDFLNSICGERAESVFATSSMAAGQTATVPLLAQTLVRLKGGQASLVFDGATAFGPHDTTFITGTKGTLSSAGPDLGTQSVTLTTADGFARPRLEGTWFNDGFRGAMAALLAAIEGDIEPINGASENLRSLSMAFAAIESRRMGREVTIGKARGIALSIASASCFRMKRPS